MSGTIFAGFVGTIEQVTPLDYDLTLTDTRRIDLVTTFLRASGAAAVSILGTIGQLSSDPEPANPTFRVVAVDATSGAVMLVYDSGPLPTSVAIGNPSSLSVGSDGKALEGRSDVFWDTIDSAAMQVGTPTGQDPRFPGNPFGLGVVAALMDGVSVDILDGSGNYEQTFAPLAIQTGLSLSGSNPGASVLQLLPFQPTTSVFNGVTVPQSAIILPWAVSQPTVGQTFKLRVYSVNAAKFFSTTGHPVDLLTQWWRNVGIPYDTSAAAHVRNIELQPLLAVNYRFDVDQLGDTTLYDATQKWILLPFGLSWNINAAGERVLFVSRDLTTRGVPTPVATITTDDLRNADAPAFLLDERAIKNRVTLTWQAIRPWDSTLDGGQRPTDGLVAVTQPPLQFDYSTSGGISIGGTPEPDSDVAGIKELRIDLPGYVGSAIVGTNPVQVGGGDTFSMTRWGTIQAIGIFGRVGRGVPIVKLNVQRLLADGHDATTIQAGDLVICSAAQVVDTRLGRFPTSQRIKEAGGARVLQVVQPSYNPNGPDLTCWDVGPAATLETVPTFTLATDAADPLHLAIATLTNPTAVAALGTGTLVVVQLGTGSSAPSGNGIDAGVIDPTLSPFTLALPPQSGGAKVWIRMAAVLPGSAPSAWSSWASVQLTAIPPVTGLAATAQPNGTDVLLTWTLGSAAFPIAVYQDGVLLAVLPAGTPQYLVEAVSGSHTYTVYEIDQPPLLGTSTVATVSGAPTGGTTLTAPIDPAAFAGRHTADGLLIIDGTYGLEVTATAIPSTVQFEIATETAVGSGSYGAYVVGGLVPAAQGGRTRFTTQAPQNDGLRRELRAKSIRNGATSSAYTAAQVVDPWSKVTLPPQPPRLFAVWGIGTLDVFLQGDKSTVSFKIAASKVGFPTDATVRAATALNATNNQATSGTLESGLAVSDLVYVSAFAYTELAGGGTESAHAQVTFIYGGGAAPVDASYLTVLPESRLPNSRQLVALAPIVLTDNGPGTQEQVSIDLTATGLGGSLIGAVCVGEFAFFGWTDYCRINGFPTALTDLNVIGLPHWKRDNADAAQLYARIQCFVVANCAGVLAVQYFNGSAWRYLDGVSGPKVSVNATGLQVGALVPVEAGALADVEMRVVAVGGTDSGVLIHSMVRMDFCQLAATTPVPPGAGAGGGGSGDCSVVASDFFEYADITAATGAGWSFSNTSTDAVWAMESTLTHDGAKALAVVITVGSSINGVLEAQRTFGAADGLLPNTHYTVKLWGYMGFRPWYDVNSQLYVNGVTDGITGFISNQGVWVQLVVRGISDSSGNLVVKLHRGGTLQSGYTGVAWDGLTIQDGDTC